nr:indolepyruvate ferredoxin oxidoreductase subunit alpha [Sporanaerobium hydrogeniformans]
MKKLVMGNEAIALGAIKAGVGVVTGYPGTPSTEVLETIAKENPGDIYVEWSVNEKVALEVAAGAAYTGMRSMVTMKQVGLNVASDPLMSLAYIGVKGGMVIVVADDPGPISSQTEQDTRHFGIFSKLPVFDPTTAEEAYVMIEDAFIYSEKYQTPVLFRPTTRVCHSCVAIESTKERIKLTPEGFIKAPKWVIFPKLAYENHLKIEKRNEDLKEDFSSYRFNELKGEGKRGIITSGVSYTYTSEVLEGLEAEYKLFKVTTPHPFPERLALEFLEGLEEVLVIEELDPVLEREILLLCGKHHLNVTIRGKLTGDMKQAGENSVDGLKGKIYEFLQVPLTEETDILLPPLPIRPPVLCAGCPHRASFYAVKKAMKGKKAVFSGDIGCYTLGNAMPLDMVDTCLCMGAGITIAQGLQRVEPESFHFAFIGDSTFFHTGLPGVINALYNETDCIVVILDNSTTAMTGNQPHPGIGKTMMGNISEKISIYKVLEALGVSMIKRVNPFNQGEALEAVAEVIKEKGVRVLLFEAPCVAISKAQEALHINEEKCRNCKVCMKELGCPALILEDHKVKIDTKLCTGCNLCQSVCPFDAIGGEKA